MPAAPEALAAVVPVARATGGIGCINRARREQAALEVQVYDVADGGLHVESRGQVEALVGIILEALQ
jgi:hypothetical protein